MTGGPWTLVHHKKLGAFPKVNLPDAALSWASGSFRLAGESVPSSRDLTATQLPIPASSVFCFFFTCAASIMFSMNLLWNPSSFSTLMIELAELAGGLDGSDFSKDFLSKDLSPKDQRLGTLKPSFSLTFKRLVAFLGLLCLSTSFCALPSSAGVFCARSHSFALFSFRILSWHSSHLPEIISSLINSNVSANFVG